MFGNDKKQDDWKELVSATISLILFISGFITGVCILFQHIV